MRLLPIDLHAHVDEAISNEDLTELSAVVFAATKSLDHAKVALKRADKLTAWGVGCHPGLVRAQRAFNVNQFIDLLATTAYVSEVGLDGGSRVGLTTQKKTFASILDVVECTPRIVSVHSYQATAEVIGLIAERALTGVVLHWWLGDKKQTIQGVEAGCYFSVNASSVRRLEVLQAIPLDRLLTETDHPAGDRFGSFPHRPGNVAGVERELARFYGQTPEQIREQMWQNLDRLVMATDTLRLLPRGLRVLLSAL